MNVSFGKKYWLVFGQTYGTLTGIRQMGDGEHRTLQFQFNDDNTGTPHFVMQDNLDELIKEEPSDSDLGVLQRMEETSKETAANRKGFVQMDLFSMMEENE